MIYFIYGDPNKIFTKANSVLESLLNKNSGSSVVKVDFDNWNNFAIDELVGGQSLFTIKQIIYLKRLFEKKETAEVLLSRIVDISKSENIFIIVEEKLDKKTFTKIEKASEKVQKFEVSKKKEIRDNVFDLTDAFGKRDPKRLWLIYRKLVKNNRVEEIHGILWWQIKAMLISRKAKNAQEAGLKPFVFSKAQSFNKNYSEKEINKISNQMVGVLHNSRRNGPELEIALEKLLLSI